MELVPTFQFKPVPPITYWWIWMPSQEVNISIGTQIRSDSTVINTHWHAHRCPTVIHDIASWKNLNWSSCLNEGNFTKMPTEFLYLSSTKNALPRTMKVPAVQRWSPLVKISKCTQLLQLRWEVIKKNKNKLELSALESSHSLDEETPVENQSNGPYMTSGGTHCNFVLCSTSCTRGTQCHQGVLWWYRLSSACSCTACTKLASRLTFRWWTGRRILYIKFDARTSFSSTLSCWTWTILLALIS